MAMHMERALDEECEDPKSDPLSRDLAHVCLRHEEGRKGYDLFYAAMIGQVHSSSDGVATVMELAMEA